MSDIRQDMQNAARGTGYRKVGKSSWWDRYDDAVVFKAENDHLEFLKDSPLKVWAQQTRRAWNSGELEPEHIAHLKRLGFERVAPVSRGAPARNGEKLDKLRDLHRRVSTLSDEERAEYERAFAELASRFRLGHASPQTAAEFGIK